METLICEYGNCEKPLSINKVCNFMRMLYVNRKLSKQPLSTGSGKIRLENSLKDQFNILKSSNFRLQALECAGSYFPVLIYCSILLLMRINI